MAARNDITNKDYHVSGQLGERFESHNLLPYTREEIKAETTIGEQII